MTHGIGFLPEVDKIIVLKNGTVRKSLTSFDLMTLLFVFTLCF